MLLAIHYISFQSKTALLPTSGLFIEFHCFEFNIKSTLSCIKKQVGMNFLFTSRNCGECWKYLFFNENLWNVFLVILCGENGEWRHITGTMKFNCQRQDRVGLSISHSSDRSTIPQQQQRRPGFLQRATIHIT